MKTVKDKLKIHKIVNCLPVPIRNKIKDCINRGVKGCILEHRKSALIVAGALGLLLAFCAYNIVADWFDDTPTLKSSITILALSLPTLFILWLFRTHDTQENINNSTFFECARLLMAEDSLCKKIALEQLTYLKRTTSFDKEKINLLTRRISLEKEVLDFAQLHYIDLSDAKLREASFIGANLSQASFMGADLMHARLQLANLHGTILVGADLRFANLTGTALEFTFFGEAIYNEKTNFKGTIYENNKKARDEAGMIYKPHKEDPKNK